MTISNSNSNSNSTQYLAENVHMQFVPTNFMIHTDDLEAACEAAGVHDKWRRAPVKASLAFTRSVKALELPTNHEVKQVFIGKEEIVFEVVSVIAHEGDKENTYRHRASIVFDRTSNHISTPHWATCSLAKEWVE